MSAAAPGRRVIKKPRPKIRTTGGSGNGSGSGGGGGTIKIRPFKRPPSLPPDFYPRSTAVLMRSLGCVLREEPLYVDDDDGAVDVGGGTSTRDGTASPKSTLAAPVAVIPGDDGGDDAVEGPAKMSISGGGEEGPEGAPATSEPTPASATGAAAPPRKNKHHRGRPISREELYRSVEDLVTHNFGPRLYLEVVNAIDGAAAECVGRLVGRAPGCVRLPNNGPVVFTADSASPSSSALGGSAATAAAAASSASASAAASSASAMATSAGTAAAVDDGQTSTLILQSIWDVYRQFAEYMRCVRSVFLHLDRRFVYVPGRGGIVVGGGGGRAVPRGSSGMSHAQTGGGGMPGGGGGGAGGAAMMSLWDVGMACLRRHVTATTAADIPVAIAAAAGTPTNETSAMSISSTGAATTTTTTGQTTTNDGDDKYRSVLQTLTTHIVLTLLRHLDSLDIDSPLTRSSVRILSDLGPSATSAFLNELVAAAIAYFDAECRRWVDMAGVGGSGDVVSYLRHVDQRLRQVGSMTGYYLAGVGTTAAASAAAAGATAIQTGSSSAAAAAAVAGHGSGSSSRLLVTIVELRLLTPHYAPQHVLHPTSLYPLLDDESRTVPDVRRLYQLGRRVNGGVDALRVAFGEYGRVRGLGIVRMNGDGGGGSAGGGSAAAASSSSAKDVKDAKMKVVPNLLAFKAHLEDLHSRAFNGDETFGRTVRGILEDVLNAGDGGDDEEHGDGGRRVAELLAKHVDLRFKNAKAGLLAVSSASAASAGSSSAAAAASSSAAAALSSRQALQTVSGGTGAVVASKPAAPTSAEEESELFQTSVLALFRHVHSKDVFEAFYKRDLAKRLLLNKSTSVDAERQFVSKLKAECGGGYTAKMEGMFKDVELSRDVMANYAAYLGGATADPITSGVEMDVQVLTTGYWPVYPQHPNLVLPAALAAHRRRFEAYYGAKYQGRRIAWQHALGNCIVRANFPKIRDSRDLVVSLCQALVLLCFNVEGGGQEEEGEKAEGGRQKGELPSSSEGDAKDKDAGLTILEVMRRTGIEDRGEAERVLQSLSMGRDGTRVLLKIDRDANGNEGSGGKKPRKPRRSVSDHDAFVFNRSFTSNQRRIRITNVQMRETAEERTKTHESVSRDRLYLIDATVVRIMKARKTLDHRGLMGETMNQLKFPASSADIKKRIESLIEREYMERAEGDRSRYNYLA